MPSPITRTAAVIAAAALGLGLSACGGDETPEETASSAPAAEQEQGPTGEVQEVPVLDEGWDGVLDDVKIENCPTEKGDVTADGTVVNSAKKPRDIVIVVSWNAPESTDPLLQLTVTKKDVGAGKTVDWSASGELPADAGQCIVLARSGALS